MFKRVYLNILMLVVSGVFSSMVQSAELKELPTEVLIQIIQEVLISELPSFPQPTSQEISDFEKTITIFNKVPRKRLQAAPLRESLQASLLELSILHTLVKFLDSAVKSSEGLVKTIFSRAASLMVSKQFQFLVQSHLPEYLVEETYKRLNTIYPFKGSTPLHAAVLLSNNQRIFEWLKSRLQGQRIPENLKTQLNKPTENALQLTPLFLAKILGLTEVVELLSQAGATAENQTNFHILLEEYYKKEYPQK